MMRARKGVKAAGGDVDSFWEVTWKAIKLAFGDAVNTVLSWVGLDGYFGNLWENAAKEVEKNI